MGRRPRFVAPLFISRWVKGVYKALDSQPPRAEVTLGTSDGSLLPASCMWTLTMRRPEYTHRGRGQYSRPYFPFPLMYWDGFFKENFLMISFYEFLYIYCLLLRVTVATLIFSSSFEYLPFSICLHSVLHCFSAFVRKPGHSSAEIASHQKNAFFSAWGTNQSESTLHSSSHFLFFSLFCGH